MFPPNHFFGAPMLPGMPPMGQFLPPPPGMPPPQLPQPPGLPHQLPQPPSVPPPAPPSAPPPGDNKAGGNNQYKTRLCNKFMSTGSCGYGDTCKYAHGAHDLRSDGERPADSRQQSSEGRGIHKTRLCEEFMRSGACRYGDKCTFAHGHEELRSSSTQTPTHQGSIMQPHAAGPKPPAPAGAPAPGAPQTPAQASAAAAAAARTGDASSAHTPTRAIEITYVDKVRAICGVLNIGSSASLSKDTATALTAAATGLRNGSAFKSNPFADDVQSYIHSQVAMGTQ